MIEHSLFLGNRGLKRETWTGCADCVEDVLGMTPSDDGYDGQQVDEAYFKMEGILNVNRLLYNFGDL